MVVNQRPDNTAVDAEIFLPGLDHEFRLQRLNRIAQTISLVFHLLCLSADLQWVPDSGRELGLKVGVAGAGAS